MLLLLHSAAGFVHVIAIAVLDDFRQSRLAPVTVAASASAAAVTATTTTTTPTIAAATVAAVV